LGGIAVTLIATLKEKGHRMTPQRQLIVELVERATGHISPEDIYDQVHERFPMVNRSTVYRTLWLLNELGLISHAHLDNGATAYHTFQPAHLHLICAKCHRIQELEDLSIVNPLAQALLEQYGFQPEMTHFAISGTCAGCRS
jgi:Fur family ferric uptake transcriptional regulator